MTDKPIRATIIGATGYTGSELLRLVTIHPVLEISSVVANKTAGKPLSQVLPSFKGIVDEPVKSFDADAVAAEADVVFCALPHAASAPVVASLRKRGQRVFDLSASFRFRDLTVYEKWYCKHPAASLLQEAVYGLVELHRDAIRTADLVAVAGCYPTSAIIALAPLLRAGLIAPNSIVVDAKSGVSGAGRGVSAALQFPEVSEGVRAYKVGVHRHAPEIDQELTAVAGSSIRVTFVPHLVPMTRGILATCYGSAIDSETTAADCIEAAKAFYANSPFVHVFDEGECPDTLWVRGSNRVHVVYARDARTGMIIAMAALDNLVKGAAGQAIQCFNIRFDLDEAAGLGAPGQWP